MQDDCSGGMHRRGGEDERRDRSCRAVELLVSSALALPVLWGLGGLSLQSNLTALKSGESSGASAGGKGQCTWVERGRGQSWMPAAKGPGGWEELASWIPSRLSPQPL